MKTRRSTLSAPSRVAPALLALLSACAVAPGAADTSSSTASADTASMAITCLGTSCNQIDGIQITFSGFPGGQTPAYIELLPLPATGAPVEYQTVGTSVSGSVVFRNVIGGPLPPNPNPDPNPPQLVARAYLPGAPAGFLDVP